MKTKVLFVGGVWQSSEENTIIANSKGSVQIAANVLQTNIIEGLDAHLEEPVTILNEIFIGAFPLRYKKSFIHHFQWNHSEKSSHVDYNIGFLNYPFVKHYSRLYQLKKYIKKELACCSDYDEIFVIGYSMTFSVVEGLRFAKEISAKVKTCLIIPDLPEYMNLGKKKNSMFNVLKTNMNKKLYEDICDIDCFVTLTEYIYRALKVKKPYTVVEGIATDSKAVSIKEMQSTTLDFVYTGSLGIKYGVVDLVDAFMKVKGENLKLIICGAGDGDEHIKCMAKIDARIDFRGIVSNEEAKALQRSAYVLVNPRSNKEEYTKYSFPSKTMEYMATGRPVLMYKLKGIPDEYDDYLYYFGEDITASIDKIARTDPQKLHAKGEKAKQFVHQYKNKNMQAKKILNLLNSLN